MLLPPAYFHLHQLHDLRKDFDGVGVGDERVHSPAVHDGGGDGLEHVSAQVHLLQLFQFGHFAEGQDKALGEADVCETALTQTNKQSNGRNADSTSSPWMLTHCVCN